MNKQTSILALDPDEAWRPALIAFYDNNGQTQGAINLRDYKMRLDASDRLTIKALRAALPFTQGVAA